MRLLPLTALFLGFAASTFAQDAKPPVLIELFTSKFCPNCPATERQFAKMADEQPDLLVVQQHVDYWDRGEMKDPYGSPDITQRQYDYSNTVGRRPGEVFTPQPILDGAKMVAPPMWLNLKDALSNARANNTKAALKPVRDGKGLSVALPSGHSAADVWVFGVEPIHTGSPVLRVRYGNCKSISRI